MSCFWLISSPESSKFLDIGNGIQSVGEILVLHNRSIHMISVGNNWESKSNALSANLILYPFDDSHDSWLDLGQFATHRTGWIHAEADIDEAEGRQGKVVFGFCLENSCFAWFYWFVDAACSDNGCSSGRRWGERGRRWQGRQWWTCCFGGNCSSFGRSVCGFGFGCSLGCSFGGKQ